MKDRNVTFTQIKASLLIKIKILSWQTSFFSMDKRTKMILTSSWKSVISPFIFDLQKCYTPFWKAYCMDFNFYNHWLFKKVTNLAVLRSFNIFWKNSWITLYHWIKWKERLVFSKVSWTWADFRDIP